MTELLEAGWRQEKKGRGVSGQRRQMLRSHWVIKLVDRSIVRSFSCVVMDGVPDASVGAVDGAEEEGGRVGVDLVQEAGVGGGKEEDEDELGQHFARCSEL